jgi:hypothetical protein
VPSVSEQGTSMLRLYYFHDDILFIAI